MFILQNVIANFLNILSLDVNLDAILYLYFFLIYSRLVLSPALLLQKSLSERSYSCKYYI